MDHDQGVIGRDRSGGLRGGNFGKQWSERFASHGAPGSEIDRREHPLLRLPWRQSQDVAEQSARVASAELAGNAAFVEFGNQAMIDDGKPAPLRLQTAEQFEQFFAIEATEVERHQFVNCDRQLAQNDRVTLEHTYDSTRKIKSTASQIPQ